LTRLIQAMIGLDAFPMTKKRSAKRSTAAATAMVLAHRVPMLWAMGFGASPRQRAEAHQMVAEKFTAGAEGAMMASLQMQREWFAAFTRWGWRPQAAAKRVAGAAMRPAQRAVKANARRLGD
jgi:hypothetical protein